MMEALDTLIKIIAWLSLVLAVWIILYIPTVYFIAYVTRQMKRS